MSAQTFLIYKPYGVLSQFTKEHPDHSVLGDIYDFPSDVYPIGRLDKDSEGLLLLSSDKKLVDKILNPKSKKEKTYLVQVEGQVTDEAIQLLSSGVEIKIKTGKYYHTLPCKARIINPPALPPRNPPIRERKSIPTSWISITLTEGKNRQVRKMCAKVGFPVLRLVRYALGNHNIEGMQPGDVREI